MGDTPDTTAGLRWAPGDRAGGGLRGYWPRQKPADGEGWWLYEVVDYGSYWRVFRNRFGVDDQPIRCRFLTCEDAIEAAEAHHAAHPELRPGKRKRRVGDWF